MQEPPFYARDRIFTVADYQSPVWTWYADGTPVDFTGCTATCAFRVSPTDAAPLFVATTIALGTPSSNPGQVSFSVARASLVGVTAPVAHGDLLIAWPGGGRVTEFAHIDLDIVQGNTQ